MRAKIYLYAGSTGDSSTVSTTESRVSTLGTVVLLEPTATKVHAVDCEFDLSWSILVPADFV